ncbi:MAG: sialate O-acetylesterase [Alistipes sp.]|nr:sialate O-acetylesterase [Alistipes sp.]
MKRIIALAGACVLAFAVPAAGKVGVASIFSDGMVLQQQRNVRIWGTSDKPTVELIPSWGEARRIEVKNGTWEASVATPVASYEKQTFTVKDADSEIVLDDLLIGEVWICSGQSNMYMPLRGYTGQPVQHAFETALEAPRYADRIRMVTLPKRDAETPRRDFDARWTVPTPQSVLSMSAAAYFFARTLTDALDVPVGIVSTSWGGAAIEAWMSPDDLREMGYDVERINADPKIEVRRQCSKLYNGLIAPVEGFAARGFVWYQGESNLRTADRYAEQMERMVRFWREKWGDKQARMPFIYVQIAPYENKNADDTDAALLMEAQIDALDRIPHAYIVCTTDTGEKSCIHPSDKLTVGRRIAAQAMRRSYGIKLPDEAVEGVRFEHAEFADGQATVTFRNAKNGLTPQGETIVGFELAGADGIFHPAEGRIVKSKPQVTVSSPEVPQPVAVRYAFRNYTPTNLHNTLGQAVLPFRSEHYQSK